MTKAKAWEMAYSGSVEAEKSELPSKQLEFEISNSAHILKWDITIDKDTLTLTTENKTYKYLRVR